MQVGGRTEATVLPRGVILLEVRLFEINMNIDGMYVGRTSRVAGVRR